jgi:hypothetical protein
MSLADFRTLLGQEIKDTAAVLSPADQDKAIGEAVKEYSKHRPRLRVHELTGDGQTYEWALPAAWEDGFSSIPGDVEYPAGRREPEYLDREQWMLYLDPAQGLRFRLLVTPGETEKVRVPFTTRHTVDPSTDTVPVIDREAVAKLAASYAARSLAAYYAQSQDPTLGADVVNHRTKPQEYSMLADRLLKGFREHLGLKETDQVRAASVSADLDTSLQPGLDHVYHPRRWR